MRISQYAHFDLVSDDVPAAAVTAALGMEPDRFRVRGSRRADPPSPASHFWSLECREPGRPLDELAAVLLRRVDPVLDRIRELVSTTGVEVRLVFVRFLDDEDGEPERFDAAVTPEGALLEKVPGQHHLLGWWLPADALATLASVGAVIWADEYG